MLTLRIYHSIQLCITLFAFYPMLAFAGTDSGTTVTCAYKTYEFDFAQVSIYFYSDGTASSSAEVTAQGRTHKESFTAVDKAAGEMVHGWISKESSENSLEMIVYQERQSLGQSKLINPHIPFGKEMWAECQISFDGD